MPEPQEHRRPSELNHFEFLREQARWSGPQGEISEVGGALLFASGSLSPIDSNGVVRYRPSSSGEDVVSHAIEWFDQRNRGFTLYTLDRDQDLADAARRAGLHEVAEVPALVCRQPPQRETVPPGIDVRRVYDLATAQDFVNVGDEAFVGPGTPLGTIREIIVEPTSLLEPHLAAFVAYEDSVPVASSLTLMSHGVGGVYFVGTLESHRRRGIGRALTVLATRTGFAMNATSMTLQTSEMGEALYRTIGYEDLYRFQMHVHLA